MLKPEIKSVTMLLFTNMLIVNGFSISPLEILYRLKKINRVITLFILIPTYLMYHQVPIWSECIYAINFILNRIGLHDLDF